IFFFSSRRRHTRFSRDWSSDVCSSDLLDEFLEWFSHETGRKVAFATPQLAQAAQNTTLRGSIAGLEPRAALEAVLATSNLVLTETSGGELIVQTPESAEARPAGAASRVGLPRAR